MFGFTVNQHFCKGELIDIKTYFFHVENEPIHHCCEAMKTCSTQNKTCDTQSANQKCPYCHDETRDIKIDDQFLTVTYAFELPEYSTNIDSHITEGQIIFNNSYTDKYIADRGPPLLSYTDIAFLMRYLL